MSYSGPAARTPAESPRSPDAPRRARRRSPGEQDSTCRASTAFAAQVRGAGDPCTTYAPRSARPGGRRSPREPATGARSAAGARWIAATMPASVAPPFPVREHDHRHLRRPLRALNAANWVCGRGPPPPDCAAPGCGRQQRVGAAQRVVEGAADHRPGTCFLLSESRLCVWTLVTLGETSRSVSGTRPVGLTRARPSLPPHSSGAVSRTVGVAPAVAAEVLEDARALAVLVCSELLDDSRPWPDARANASSTSGTRTLRAASRRPRSARSGRRGRRRRRRRRPIRRAAGRGAHHRCVRVPRIRRRLEPRDRCTDVRVDEHRSDGRGRCRAIRQHLRTVTRG